MENCLAGADEWRGGEGPLVLERGPADEPALQGLLRGGAAGRLRADERRQRLPPGGLRPVRPQHPPRPPPQRRARLPAPGARPAQPRAAHAAVWCRASLFEGTRAVGVEALHRGRRETIRVGRGDPLRRRDQLAPAPAALGRGRPGAPALGRRRSAPRPAGRRREPPGPPRGLRAARLHPAGVARSRRSSGATGRSSARAGCSCARAPAPPTTSRAAVSPARTTRSSTRT